MARTIPARRRGASTALASVALLAVAVATAAIALGPRSVVADGESAVGRWLASHARLDGIVAQLGGIQDAGNLVLFVPVAVLVAAAVPIRWLAAAFVLCAALPAATEFAQHWLPGRVPDLSDVVLNTVGLVLAFAGATAIRLGVAAVATAARPRA